MASATQVPPQNIEAEESVLGALLVTDSAWADVHKVALSPTDLYLDKHRLLYAAIADLASRAAPCDPISVTDALERSGRLEEAGGKHYIAELAAKVSAPGNAAHYASIVLAHAVERGKGEVGRDLSNGLGPVEAIEKLRKLECRRAGIAGGLAVRGADLSRVRPVRWLWDRRLLLGYLCLILGAEGMGKGTVAAWLIARLTRGELPGDLAGEPSRVLVLGDEDAFDSVWVPRLHVAGADLGLVDTVDEGEGEAFDLRDEGRLRALVEEHGYRLLFFDALLDVLGADVDDWRSKEVRDRLRPLRRLARELDVCALGSLHPNKGQRSNFRDLVSGSHAFNASSRSSLLLAPHPEDEDRRVLVRGKGNLSAAPPSFEFAIEGRDLEINGHAFSLPVLADECDGEMGVEDIVKPQREAPVRDTLADQINAVGNGEIQSRAEIAKALGREADDRSVGRALDTLEDQGRWEKVGRGKWRAIGIGTSSEVPMSKVGSGGKESEAICRNPDHRSSDYAGDGGKPICGVCHPRTRSAA